MPHESVRLRGIQEPEPQNLEFPLYSGTSFFSGTAATIEEKEPPD